MKTVYNFEARPKGYKTFLCSTKLSIKFQLLIKAKKLKNIDFFFFQTLSWCTDVYC